MKIAYAFRRAMVYPYTGPAFVFPPREARAGWLRKIKNMGFEGIEVGLDAAGPNPTEQSVGDLRRELDAAGVPCVVVRGGGGLIHSRTLHENRKRMEQAVRFASWIGAGVANTTVGTPATDPGKRGSTNTGDSLSQGSSRLASEDDYERTAKGLREVGGIAGDLGVDIAIEVHQHSIVDNSWSALHLLRLIDRKNVGVNPDLGNVYWTYDVPEETSEEAIVALAPHAKYWHCKNLQRINIESLEKSIFLRVPLPDGDIDYRFAITAMRQANYQGYLAIEGLQFGDQLTGDGKGAEYAREILRALAADAV